jgi:hypothetical protein
MRKVEFDAAAFGGGVSSHVPTSTAAFVLVHTAGAGVPASTITA